MSRTAINNGDTGLAARTAINANFTEAFGKAERPPIAPLLRKVARAPLVLIPMTISPRARRPARPATRTRSRSGAPSCPIRTWSIGCGKGLPPAEGQASTW